jgi:hypothetical protein
MQDGNEAKFKYCDYKNVLGMTICIISYEKSKIK